MDLGRKFGSVILLLSWLVSHAGADVVVLRNGRQIRGVVADREWLTTQLGAISTIAILPDSAGSAVGLLRLDRSEVDHVVLEDAGGRRVFDLISRSAIPDQQKSDSVVTSPSSPQEPPWTPRPDRFGITSLRTKSIAKSNARTTGEVLIVGGIIAAVVGATVKMGEPKLVISASEVRYEDKSYNEANVALISVGVLAAVIGIATVTANSAKASIPSPSGGRDPRSARMSWTYQF